MHNTLLNHLILSEECIKRRHNQRIFSQVDSAFLPQGIMRVQCACLLLLLLPAAALSQSYNDFERKHILPEKGSQKCDDMMKKINGINQCKPINTFLKAKVDQIVKLCRSYKNDWAIDKFDVIDCKRKSQKPCTYTDLNLREQKKIKCENGLPVIIKEC
uniref:Ribonuclease A-domain domain-containing protein n=1 Tax=Amphilophus citrinellus TaxID=61819 RepID=A0A3Q0RL61_AMPCI